MPALPGHTSKQGTGNKPKNHLTEKPPYKSANHRPLSGGRHGCRMSRSVRTSSVSSSLAPCGDVSGPSSSAASPGGRRPMSIRSTLTSIRSIRVVRAARFRVMGNSGQCLPISAARATRRCRIDRLASRAAVDLSLGGWQVRRSIPPRQRLRGSRVSGSNPVPSSGESTNFRFLLMRACSPRQMVGVRPIAQLVFHQRRGFTGSGAPNSRTLISRCSTDVISGASSELLSDVDIRRDLPPPLPLKRDYRLNRRPLWVKGRGRGVKLTFAPGFGRSARCFQLFPWCQELRFTGPFIDGARSQAAKVNILT